MNTSKMILPAVLTVFLAGGGVFASSAMAGPHHDGEGRGMYMMGPGDCPMYRGKGGKELTPEQRQKVGTVMSEGQAKLTPLRDKLYVKQQELRALQNAANPDVKAVSQTASEIASLREQLRKERMALGDRLDKELGLEPGTHRFDGYGHRGGRGYHNGDGYGHRGGNGYHDGNGYGPRSGDRK